MSGDAWPMVLHVPKNQCTDVMERRCTRVVRVVSYGAESRWKVGSSSWAPSLCQHSSKSGEKKRKARDGLHLSFGVPMIQWD